MRRVQQGEVRRRAADLQDKISIAVADFDFLQRVSCSGGTCRWKTPRGTAREPIFRGIRWHCFGPENMLAPFSGGVSDTRPQKILYTHNPVGLCFLIF